MAEAYRKRDSVDQKVSTPFTKSEIQKKQYIDLETCSGLFEEIAVVHEKPIIQIFVLEADYPKNGIGIGAQVVSINEGFESFAKDVCAQSRLKMLGGEPVDELPFDDIMKQLRAKPDVKNALWNKWDKTAEDRLEHPETVKLKHSKKLNTIFKFRYASLKDEQEFGAMVVEIDEDFLYHAKQVEAGWKIVKLGNSSVDGWTFSKIMKKIEKQKKKTMKVEWEKGELPASLVPATAVSTSTNTEEIVAPTSIAMEDRDTDTNDSMVGDILPGGSSDVSSPVKASDDPTSSEPSNAASQSAADTPDDPLPIIPHSPPATSPVNHESKLTLQFSAGGSETGAIQSDVDYDLAFLTSHPLCGETHKSKVRMAAPLLEFETERNLLMQICQNAAETQKRDVRYMHSIGTSGKFAEIVMQNTRMLHFSGNCSDDQLLLETECTTSNVGLTVKLDSERVRDLIKHGDLKFVFISSRSADEVGELFEDCQVPHIITLRGENSDNSFAQEFIRNFYNAVFAGKSIQFAFERAKKAMLVINSKDQASELVSLLPEDGDHSECLYPKLDGSGYMGGELIDLSPAYARGFNLGDDVNVISRSKLQIQIIESVLKNAFTILQGSYGVGKTELLKIVGRYLSKRKMFMKGILYFKFEPETNDRETRSLAAVIDTKLANLGAKGTPRQRVRNWVQSKKPTGTTQGMLILLDDVHKLLLEDPSCPFISADERKINVRFLKDIMNVKGVKVIASAPDSRLFNTLFGQKLNPTPVSVTGMSLEESVSLLYLQLEQQNLDQAIMNILRSHHPKMENFTKLYICEDIGVVNNTLQGRPSRILYVALEYAERLRELKDWSEHNVLELLSGIARDVKQSFLDFWIGELNNTAVAKCTDILEKLDLYIQRRCGTMHRGLFWTIWDSLIPEEKHIYSELNIIARKELCAWLEEQKALSRDRFKEIWKARFHSLEAEIRNFGNELWEKPGAIAGFWNKKIAQNFLKGEAVGTFIVRFSRTFTHHVNIMCKKQSRIAKILLALRRNGCTLTIAEGNTYGREREPLQNYILNDRQFASVFNLATRGLEPKESIYRRVPKPLSTRCDYRCCPDFQPGREPQRQEVMVMPRLGSKGSGVSLGGRNDGGGSHSSYRNDSSRYDGRSRQDRRDAYEDRNKMYKDRSRRDAYENRSHSSYRNDSSRYDQRNRQDRGDAFSRDAYNDRSRRDFYDERSRRNHDGDRSRKEHRHEDYAERYQHARNSRQVHDGYHESNSHSRGHRNPSLQEARSHQPINHYGRDSLPTHQPQQRRHHSEQPRRRNEDFYTEEAVVPNQVPPVGGSHIPPMITHHTSDYQEMDQKMIPILRTDESALDDVLGLNFDLNV